MSSRVSPSFRRSTAIRRRTVVPAAVLMGLLVGVATAPGQDEEGRIQSWQRLEGAPEMRSYKESIRGGTFDATARRFLEQTALPQLALEANRPMIERVRRRMRELLLGDINAEAAAEEAVGTFLTFMGALADNADEPPVVRVNAMLLVGELQGTDRRPWKPAVEVLAREAAEANQSKAVRIAAVVGLARHIEAAKASAEDRQRLAGIVHPAVRAILKELDKPTDPGNAVADDWLATRCLAMLPLLGPIGADLAAPVAAILSDGNRSLDVRVRAAAALAAAGPEAKVDTAAAITAINALAVESLEKDIAAAERLRLEQDQALGASPGLGAARAAAPPGLSADPTQSDGPALMPSEVGRRAAWRLVTLADAILTEDRKRGLAVLAGGDPQADARRIAELLRGGAMQLDKNPEESVVRQVLDDIRPPPPAKDENAAAAWPSAVTA